MLYKSILAVKVQNKRLTSYRMRLRTPRKGICQCRGEGDLRPAAALGSELVVSAAAHADHPQRGTRMVVDELHRRRSA